MKMILLEPIKELIYFMDAKQDLDLMYLLNNFIKLRVLTESKDRSMVLAFFI